MRLAYLAIWSSGPDTGVGRKLLAQARAWVEAGHQVRLVVLTRSEAWRHAAAPGVDLAPEVWKSPFALIPAWRRARNALSAWVPEALYVRQTIWLPGLEGLARRWPTVVEIQTDDLAELAPHPWKGFYNRLTRGRLLGACAGMVAMTGELANLPHFRAFGKPSTVIANSIPAFQPLLCEDRGAKPRLVFLGTPGQTWHGEDRIMAMAQALPEFAFDVIGSLEPRGRGPDNIAWHGWLDRQSYRSLVAQATVGIGTLALYRKRMDEACPLKVREYLSHGLPVIIGYRDSDFPDDVPFLLRIPNAEGNVEASIEEIRAFVRHWMGRRISAADVAHLSSSVKEDLRLKFLTTIVSSHQCA